MPLEREASRTWNTKQKTQLMCSQMNSDFPVQQSCHMSRNSCGKRWFDASAQFAEAFVCVIDWWLTSDPRGMWQRHTRKEATTNLLRSHIWTASTNTMTANWSRRYTGFRTNQNTQGNAIVWKLNRTCTSGTGQIAACWKAGNHIHTEGSGEQE